MMFLSKSRNLVISTFLVLGSGLQGVQAAAPTAEEMWKVIQEQQKVIEQLKSQLQQTEQKVQVTEQKVEETKEEVEAAAEAIETASTTSGSGWWDRTSVGGYGELHYNNLSDDNDTVGGNDDLDRIDFHRFVLFFGHEFTDSIRFFSELELEHALTVDTADGSGPGEVELEQAWIEMDINENHRFRAGLDIIPVGIINVTHEPDTFYGVERNRVESEIIPATWWEAGAGFLGEFAPGWNYHVVAHGGLLTPTTGSSTLRPRSGRSKVAQADDQDIAFTGQLRYTGMPGLEVGLAAQYQADITGTADTFDVEATLFEGHVDYKHSSGLGLRALYARWDYDVPAGIAFTQDNLDGWYIEPAYRFKAPAGIKGDIGVFTRYSQWDERGRGNVPNGEFVQFERWDVGVNWWPTDNVAFKFDYQNESGADRADAVRDGINLGIGYQF